MKKSSIFAAFAVAASLSFGSSVNAHERVIPQSLLDRYGDTLTGTSKPDREEECRGFRDLISNGNILKHSFANGQGRATVHVSRDNGGTIGLNVDIGTAGGLKPQDCSSWLPF